MCSFLYRLPFSFIADVSCPSMSGELTSDNHTMSRLLLPPPPHLRLPLCILSTLIAQHLAALRCRQGTCRPSPLDQVATPAWVSSVGVVCGLLIGALTTQSVRGLSGGASATRAGELGGSVHAVLGCCGAAWEEASLAWKTTGGLQTETGEEKG